MLVNTRIDKRQQMVATLIKYAAEISALDYKAVSADELDEMLSLAEGAAQQLLKLEELRRLTELVQRTVRLQVYTIQQAAAWLGMSDRGVSAATREGRIRATKPGHDLVITHKSLVDFYERKRFSPATRL